MGLIVLLLSILLPGWGTIIAGILAKGESQKPAIIVGILQIVTCWLLIGWVWSIITGLAIYKNSQ